MSGKPIPSLGDLRIGTAGWSIPRHQAAAFPGNGSHLERYAQVFRATEINSSFHRPHKPQTYARWAASVPAEFRFAVKLPRDITHTARLIGTERMLDDFLAGVRNLGDRLGPLLIQLPPGLAFAEDVALGFLDAMRLRFDGELVCEPRHPSWFDEAADIALASRRVVRVAADPARVPEAARPGGWTGLAYRRLHGSPRVYYSPYSPLDIDRIACEMRSEAGQHGASWCIFDNTTLGEATRNARQLLSAFA
jgi:uncharacterized protein YecE (DUF72 family)